MTDTQKAFFQAIITATKAESDRYTELWRRGLLTENERKRETDKALDMASKMILAMY